MATVNETLLTAEEFLKLGPDEVPEYCELIEGKIIEMNVPAPRHGQICAELAFQLKLYCREHSWGHVVSNDSGIITKRKPDSVRGADVACYSYSRVPKGPLPTGYLDAVPEVVCEILSPDDRWPQTLVKVAEYLEAGVGAVCVIVPEQQSVHVFRLNGSNALFHDTDPLTLPDILPGLELQLADIFG